MLNVQGILLNNKKFFSVPLQPASTTCMLWVHSLAKCDVVSFIGLSLKYYPDETVLALHSAGSACCACYLCDCAWLDLLNLRRLWHMATSQPVLYSVAPCAPWLPYAASQREKTEKPKKSDRFAPVSCCMGVQVYANIFACIIFSDKTLGAVFCQYLR